MAGAILIIFVLVVVLPVLFLLSMAAVAGFLGYVARRRVAENYRDTELLSLAESENSLMSPEDLE